MALWACQKTQFLAIFAGSAFAVAASPAFAEEAKYCVTCKNPHQTYVCRVMAGGSKPSDAFKLYCVIRLAKEGHHASCSADSSSICNGVEKVYSYDGPMPDDLASDPHIKKLQSKIEEQQKIFEPPKGNEPHTLVDLTGRAMSASRQRWRNARGALAGSPQPAGQPSPQDGSTPLASQQAQAAPPVAPQADSTQHTGSGVTSFARKSYHCMISLFRNCRDAPTATAGVQ
jgi:hypothetical protein